MLHDYQVFDRVSVLMENNSAYKTVEIGFVRIRMFDGVIQILIVVRYVLELRKNLISLSWLRTDVRRVSMSKEDSQGTKICICYKDM